jgi:hypothetical protein
VKARQSISLTPKALRVQELRSQGMSFDEAFGLADSEYSGDGMSLKPAATDMLSVLSGGPAQMGEVQI